MPRGIMPNSKKIPPAPLFILNDLFTEYYRKIRYAKEKERLIAWATIGIPKNIFFAMNIIPVYPQFHAAFQSTRGKARHIFRNIESKYEIPHDICGEVKSMMGTILSGERLSFGLPEPDFVISGNGACGAAAKGLDFLSRYMKAPLFFCDFPFVSTDRAEPHTLEYVNSQLDEIIKSLESAYGTRFDEKEYHRLMENEYKALIVWREILKLCAHNPAPVNAMDLYLFFMPFIILEPNDDALLEVLIKLYNDLFIRSKKYNDGLKDTNNNEIRLLWDILPVYHKMNFFTEIFQAYDANVVMSTYLIGNSFYPESMNLKFEHPLDKRQVADALKNTSRQRIENYYNISLEQDANRPIEQRKKLIKKIIRDYNIQGVVMHMDRTCRPMSLPQYELMKYIQESLNVPAMLFHADSMDERYFSDAQVSTRLEAFLEGLAGNRR
jgi:benzoyl-CoA reductase/2-hydroxyglutaryl-CoA dehydratase subunit BcrC/BadD/HgdB